MDHVREACKLVDGGHVNLKRAARSTFLRFDDRVYPAKFVRGLAYFLATGVELDPNNDYAGGKETVRFFQKLGLQASNRGEWANSVPTPIPVKMPKVALRTPVNGRKYEPQKRALLGVLQKRFGTVTCEAAFSWLTVPDRGDLDCSGPITSVRYAFGIGRIFQRSFASCLYCGASSVRGPACRDASKPTEWSLHAPPRSRTHALGRQSCPSTQFANSFKSSSSRWACAIVAGRAPY